MTGEDILILCIVLLVVIVAISALIWLISIKQEEHNNMIKNIRKRRINKILIPEDMNHYTYFTEKITKPIYEPFKVKCDKCAKKLVLNIKPEDYKAWKADKKPIQDAMPYLSSDERELLISNVCGECFDDIFETPVRDGELQSFITGSYAYGTPTESSDIDMVILLNSGNVLHTNFLKMQDVTESNKIMFGNLNIIAVYEQETFDAWQFATEELIKRKPVTRQEAIECIDEKLTNAGCIPAEYITGLEDE